MTPAWATRWVQSWTKLRFGLPILVKDLTELAARRRTYIVRTVYAALLFVAFTLFFMVAVSNRGSTYRLLGAGRGMLEFLIVIQLVGIYLFLPAMVVDSIAGEKERGTLALLFSTDLRPWEILLQKYFSRLIPMFTFLLLSLPLMAVAYSFGGFSSRRLLLAAYVIFTTCMQVAAFALVWSAFCRTTSEATGATYSGAILLFIATVLLSFLLSEYYGFRNGYAFSPMISVFPSMLLIGVPFGGLPAGAAAMPWVWTLLFLLAARRFLVTRGFVKKKRPKDLFKQAHKLLLLLMSLRKGFRAGRRHRPVGDLPGRDPVTWRELASSSLRTPGGFAFTAAVFGLVLGGAAAIFVHQIGFHDGQGSIGVSLIVFGVWLVGAVSVTVKSASAFGLERANNTLTLLLTTPLTGREIVAQKAAAVRRRALLIFVLLGALFLVEVILDTRWGSGHYRRGLYGYQSEHGRHQGLDFGQFGYLLVSFLSVVVYLSMVGWVAGWIGLRLRKQAHATGLAFGAIFGICVAPFFLAPIVAELTGTYIRSGPQWLFAFSPGTIVVLTEFANFDDIFHEMFDTHAAWPILLNFTLHGGIALFFRRLCLANADRYLGRPVSSGDPE